MTVSRKRWSTILVVAVALATTTGGSALAPAAADASAGHRSEALLMLRHPHRLQLVDTVKQHRRPPSETRVVIAHEVRFPAVFSWQFAACTQTSERVDGLGIPGASGSRGCGDRHISYSQSLHWLG